MLLQVSTANLFTKSAVRNGLDSNFIGASLSHAKIVLSEKEPIMSRVVIKNVRLSYPALREPEAFGEQKPKYKTTALFAPGSQKELGEAIEAAIHAKWGEDRPHASRLRMPVKDGNDKIDPKTNKVRPEFKDQYYLTASSYNKPVVVGPNVELLEDDSMIFPGQVANVSVTIGTYDNEFGCGVSLYLGNVQIVGGGESFVGGATSPEDEFSPASPF